MSWGFGQKRKRTLSIRVAGAGRAGRHGLRELVGDGKVIRCSAVSLEELLHQECQSGQGDDGGDVAAIVEGGGTATAIKADVADESDVAALFDAAEELYGGVDVVVTPAGSWCFR